jgi:DNA-binding transcriptional MerR regulator
MATPIPSSASYPEIPDKLYFRIGEVSRLAGVKPYVLRYWETEFSSIGPKKSGSNHRLYRRKDVELVLEIKHLLYEKRYTIEGARKLLQDQNRARAEARPLAKPVQAAVAVATPMAMAMGSSTPAVAAPSAPAGPSISAATAMASPVAAASSKSSTATVGAGSAAGTATSRAKESAAASKVAPSPDLVGSIRRELVSLLALLSR